MVVVWALSPCLERCGGSVVRCARGTKKFFHFSGLFIRGLWGATAMERGRRSGSTAGYLAALTFISSSCRCRTQAKMINVCTKS